MVIHAYDNYTGAWTESALTTNQTIGSRITKTNADDITKIGWYRQTTGTGKTPQNLRLYTAGSVPDSGAVGWQWHTLSTPQAAGADTQFVVATGWNDGQVRANVPTGTVGAPPSGLAWTSTPSGCYSNSGNNVFPDTGAGVYLPCDLETGSSAPPVPGDTDPVTYGVLSAEIDRRLSASSSVNTHQSELPWLTKAAADAIKTTTDRLNNLSNGAITWLNERSSQAVDFLNSASADWVAFLNGASARLTGSSAAGGSAFYAPSGQSIGLNTDETLALLQLLVATQRNAMVGFPAAPWVQAAETTFDTSLAWTEPADLYVVSFTDLGSSLINTVAAGVDVSYRLAWWCPLIGSAGQQRRFIDFPEAHLWLDGQRMPGLLLHSPQGATGSVQAWLYS